jgi:hypothetical protein
MNQWLRTGRHGIVHWESFYTQGRADGVPTGPSPFAQWVAERVEPGSRIIELGSGTGRDAIWLARQGHPVIGSDYCLAARRYAGAKAKAAGVDVPFRELNLAVVRSLLVRGARMSRLPGLKHVYARLVVDEVHPSARPGLWRFCSMVNRTGGRTYVEFRTDANRIRFVQRPAWPSPETVAAEIGRAGGRIRDQEVGRGLAHEGGRNPVICRMEVEWT